MWRPSYDDTDFVLEYFHISAQCQFTLIMTTPEFAVDFETWLYRGLLERVI